MATFEIIVGGESTVFPRDSANVDGSELAWVEGESGVGMVPLQRERQQGPRQHGATNRGFLLLPRRFALIFGMRGASLGELYDKRSELLDLLAPTDTPIVCRWTLDNGAVRQIDAYYSSDLAYPSQDRVGFYQRVSVGFEALDPTFYDPVAGSASFGIAAGSGAFEVPLEVPWEIGNSAVDQTIALSYPGNWQTSPTIIIDGPITDPVIQNLTTSEVLYFDGLTIASGDRYIIDTRYSAGTVVDAAGDSQIDKLGDGSDLTTFHLASIRDTPGGINQLRVTGTAATEATQVFVQYTIRYLGL